jgi:hypothetical protein
MMTPPRLAGSDMDAIAIEPAPIMLKSLRRHYERGLEYLCSRAISNESDHTVAVASGHVNLFWRTVISAEQRSARRDKKIIVAGAGDHA